ncbi:nitroreductase/quinone reductase family protein [Demequina capsici]|uniref:Nitroreductase/quinone reductase family protein n=1 Tax=Demequina capsici TaxID=3075620 RepID=A0AA96J647_9MICO|nr:nitroreductase/quinone reductase family protein [Demequina sp. OYTSA14]WNM23832.1 nitroreductase/quinone reductase family protein [Demequina sp. OYTSA14]
MPAAWLARAGNGGSDRPVHEAHVPHAAGLLEGDVVAGSPSGFNDAIIEQFRANEGHVAQFGRHLVLLHHIGARSGAERVSPVMTFPADGGGWLIAASKAGAPDHPAWYHNLRAHPKIVIEVPGEGEVDVVAEELLGAERDAAWRVFTEGSAGFADYERRTSRVIPVIRLRRA